jgi:hypothetical protein
MAGYCGKEKQAWITFWCGFTFADHAPIVTSVLLAISSNCKNLSWTMIVYIPCSYWLGVLRTARAQCHVSCVSLRSVESNLCSMNSSGLMTASLLARYGCTLAQLYLLSQQTSLPVSIYPTNGYSGSPSHSSSCGKSLA